MRERQLKNSAGEKMRSLTDRIASFNIATQALKDTFREARRDPTFDYKESDNYTNALKNLALLRTAVEEAFNENKKLIADFKDQDSPLSLEMASVVTELGKSSQMNQTNIRQTINQITSLQTELENFFKEVIDDKEVIPMQRLASISGQYAHFFQSITRLQKRLEQHERDKEMVRKARNDKRTADINKLKTEIAQLDATGSQHGVVQKIIEARLLDTDEELRMFLMAGQGKVLRDYLNEEIGGLKEWSKSQSGSKVNASDLDILERDIGTLNQALGRAGFSNDPNQIEEQLVYLRNVHWVDIVERLKAVLQTAKDEGYSASLPSLEVRASEDDFGEPEESAAHGAGDSAEQSETELERQYEKYLSLMKRYLYFSSTVAQQLVKISNEGTNDDIHRRAQKQVRAAELASHLAEVNKDLHDVILDVEAEKKKGPNWVDRRLGRSTKVKKLPSMRAAVSAIEEWLMEVRVDRTVLDDVDLRKLFSGEVAEELRFEERVQKHYEDIPRLNEFDQEGVVSTTGVVVDEEEVEYLSQFIELVKEYTPVSNPEVMGDLLFGLTNVHEKLEGRDQAAAQELEEAVGRLVKPLQEHASLTVEEITEIQLSIRQTLWQIQEKYPEVDEIAAALMLLTKIKHRADSNDPISLEGGGVTEEGVETVTQTNVSKEFALQRRYVELLLHKYLNSHLPTNTKEQRGRREQARQHRAKLKLSVRELLNRQSTDPIDQGVVDQLLADLDRAIELEGNGTKTGGHYANEIKDVLHTVVTAQALMEEDMSQKKHEYVVTAELGALDGPGFYGLTQEDLDNDPDLSSTIDHFKKEMEAIWKGFEDEVWTQIQAGKAIADAITIAQETVASKMQKLREGLRVELDARNKDRGHRFEDELGGWEVRFIEERMIDKLAASITDGDAKGDRDTIDGMSAELGSSHNETISPELRAQLYALDQSVFFKTRVLDSTGVNDWKDFYENPGSDIEKIERDIGAYRIALHEKIAELWVHLNNEPDSDRFNTGSWAQIKQDINSLSGSEEISELVSIAERFESAYSDYETVSTVDTDLAAAVGSVLDATSDAAAWKAASDQLSGQADSSSTVGDERGETEDEEKTERDSTADDSASTAAQGDESSTTSTSSKSAKPDKKATGTFENDLSSVLDPNDPEVFPKHDALKELQDKIKNKRIEVSRLASGYDEDVAKFRSWRNLPRWRMTPEAIQGREETFKERREELDKERQVLLDLESTYLETLKAAEQEARMVALGTHESVGAGFAARIKEISEQPAFRELPSGFQIFIKKIGEKFATQTDDPVAQADIEEFLEKVFRGETLTDREMARQAHGNENPGRFFGWFRDGTVTDEWTTALESIRAQLVGEDVDKREGLYGVLMHYGELRQKLDEEELRRDLAERPGTAEDQDASGAATGTTAKAARLSSEEQAAKERDIAQRLQELPEELRNRFYDTENGYATKGTREKEAALLRFERNAVRNEQREAESNYEKETNEFYRMLKEQNSSWTFRAGVNWFLSPWQRKENGWNSPEVREQYDNMRRAQQNLAMVQDKRDVRIREQLRRHETLMGEILTAKHGRRFGFNRRSAHEFYKGKYLNAMTHKAFIEGVGKIRNEAVLNNMPDAKSRLVRRVMGGLAVSGAVTVAGLTIFTGGAAAIPVLLAGAGSGMAAGAGGSWITRSIYNLIESGKERGINRLLRKGKDNYHGAADQLMKAQDKLIAANSRLETLRVQKKVVSTGVGMAAGMAAGAYVSSEVAAASVASPSAPGTSALSGSGTPSMYDAQPGDNFWDIMEGQTHAGAVSNVDAVDQSHKQALIDLVRDKVNTMSVSERSALGFGGSADSLAIGVDVDLGRLDALAGEIAVQQGWLDSPVASPGASTSFFGSSPLAGSYPEYLAAGAAVGTGTLAGVAAGGARGDADQRISYVQDGERRSGFIAPLFSSSNYTRLNRIERAVTGRSNIQENWLSMFGLGRRESVIFKLNKLRYNKLREFGDDLDTTLDIPGLADRAEEVRKWYAEINRMIVFLRQKGTAYSVDNINQRTVGEIVARALNSGYTHQKGLDLTKG